MADAARLQGRLPCLVITLLDFLSISIVVPLLPGLAADTGAQPGQWVWIVAANGVVLTVGPFIWGKILNKENIVGIITFTLIIKAVCLLTLAIPGMPFEWLVFNRVVSGAMSGTTLAGQLWLVSQSTDSEVKARAIADLSIASSVGVGLGALAAAPILSAVERAADFNETAMIVFTILAFVIGSLSLAAHFVLKRSDLADDGQPATDAPLTAPRTLAIDALSVLLVNTIGRVCAYAFPVVIILAGEQDQGLTLATATLVISLLAFLEIPSQFIVAASITSFGYRSSTFAFILLATLGLFIPAIGLSETSAIASAIIFSFAAAALQSILSVYLTEQSEESVPMWLGVAQGLGGAARAGAPLLAAVLFSFGPENSFIVLGLVSLIAGPLVLMMNELRSSGTSDLRDV